MDEKPPKPRDQRAPDSPSESDARRLDRLLRKMGEAFRGRRVLPTGRAGPGRLIPKDDG